MSIWKAVSAGVLVIPLAFGAPAVADNKTVILEDESFSPREVNINPGDSVTWRHRDKDTPHSVTFEDGYDPYQGCSEPDLLNGCMQEGDSTQRTFLVSGTFRYYCRIHQKAGMTGVVNVLGPGGAAPVGTTSTTRLTGGSGSSSSSSSSTTATTELVASTSTTRPALVASIPTTTTTPRPAYAPAPRASAPPLNTAARDNEEQLAALPAPEGEGDSEATGGTGGGGSGSGSLGLVGGLAVAVAGAAGVLAWKFRPRGRIA